MYFFWYHFPIKKHYFLIYLFFFASALQFEALFMLMCGIQFLSCKSYVKRPCAPWNRYLLSNFTCLWYRSSSTWCAESENTWKFTNFCWVPLFAARFNRLNSFFQPSGFRCRSLSILLFFQKKSWSSLFLFQFETWEQWIFSSENFAVNLYPIKVVARAFEWNVAIIFVVSISVVLIRIELLDLLRLCVVFFDHFLRNLNA